MTAEQAKQHNDASPFTVAPCDYTRSFPMRSFSTLEAARDYAAQQGGRPFVIALPSGALAEAEESWTGPGAWGVRGVTP